MIVSTKHISKLWLVAMVTILTLAGLPIKSLAQGVSVAQPSISFSVLPEFPKPGENVFIEAQSFSTDLNQADFVWKLNGAQLSSGRGLKTATVLMGKSGVKTTIVVNIKTHDGFSINRQFDFKPATVTLIAEATSYTPPFYKGLPLMSRGSSIKIVAIPEFFDSKGKRLNPKDLVYNWKQNDENLGDDSGYGKDSITINQTSYLNSSDKITVEAFSTTNSVAGSGLINVSVTENPILLYENIPSLGTLFNHAISNNFIFNKKELTLVEVPYFVSVKSPTQPILKTDWLVNGVSMPQFSGKDRVVFPLSQPGSGTVGVSVRNVKKVMQGGDVSVSITIPE